MQKEKQDFDTKLLIATSIPPPQDSTKSDYTDRKTFVDQPFLGNTSLTSFIDDLRTESMARRGWEDLLLVEGENGEEINLLDRFNSISEDMMQDAQSNRTQDEIETARNIYIATWRSLGSAPKREMKPHRSAINNDGPTFLWHLFRYYHTTAEQTVRTTLSKMDKLSEALVHQCKNNTFF